MVDKIKVHVIGGINLVQDCQIIEKIENGRAIIFIFGGYYVGMLNTKHLSLILKKNFF